MSETFVLKHPITLKDRVITELEIRDPVARDLRTLPVLVEHQTWGHQLELLASLSAEPLRVINELAGEDVIELVNLIQKKLVPGL
jgi:hypothetical protein